MFLKPRNGAHCIPCWVDEDASSASMFWLNCVEWASVLEIELFASLLAGSADDVAGRYLKK